MEAFAVASCKAHPDHPATHICYESACKFACQLCLARSDCCSHRKYTMDIPAFICSIADTVGNLERLEQRASARYSQLIDLSSKAKVQFAQDDEHLIKDIMRMLEGENREYKECSYKLNQSRTKLMNVLQLIRYFQPFHDALLFQIKVNLASTKGLRRFFKKVADHSALLNKGVSGQLKKIQNNYLLEQKKLLQLENGSLIFSLKEILKQRDTLKERERDTLKEREREREKLKEREREKLKEREREKLKEREREKLNQRGREKPKLREKQLSKINNKDQQ